MSTKPKVLVVYDSPNWAFHRIALQIERYLSDQFDIELFGYFSIFSRQVKPLVADVVVLLAYQAIAMKTKFSFLPENAKIIVCQYDDNVWRSEPDQGVLLRDAMRLSDMALFAHERLKQTIQSELGDVIPGKVGLCEDGVDPEFFDFRDYLQGNWRKDPMVVGWAGNPSGEFHGGDNKGIGIIKEALRDLPGVELAIANREAHWRSLIEMVSWYRDIHLILCMSNREGTPNPILEAGSTGRGFISTNVGIIPDLLKRAQAPTPGVRTGTQAGIVIERTPVALRYAIECLRDDRDRLRAMGYAAAQAVRTQWTWKEKVEQFRWAIQGVLS